MKMHWIIVLVLLVFATGCDQKQKAEDAARDAEQNAKVAEAVKNQKRGAMAKPSEGPAEPAGSKDDKDDSAKKDGSATKNGKPDDGKSDEGKSDEGKEDAVEKTETSAKLNAKTVLDSAIATAKTENKALFVHFTADWWGYCHKLEEFLEANEDLFADDYHFVAIATDKMEGGEEIMNELKQDRQGGLPWMVILDGDGKELVTSNDPDGKNVGCPVAPHETKHFVEMIKQTSDASDEEIGAVNDAIELHAKKIQDASNARRAKAEAQKAKTKKAEAEKAEAEKNKTTDEG